MISSIFHYEYRARCTIHNEEPEQEKKLEAPLDVTYYKADGTIYMRNTRDYRITTLTQEETAYVERRKEEIKDNHESLLDWLKSQKELFNSSNFDDMRFYIQDMIKFTDETINKLTEETPPPVPPPLSSKALKEHVAPITQSQDRNQEENRVYRPSEKHCKQQ